MKEKLVKMAAKKQCDGTVCPAGCCPEQNWFCCPLSICCNEGEACQDGCQEAVSGNNVPSWMLPRTKLVLLPVHLLPQRRSLSRWLPRSSVKEQCAQLDAAQSKTGSAAQMTCTVLLLLLTVHLLPQRRSLSRWLPRSSEMEQCAQLVAAQSRTGSAAQMTCTVLLLLLTVHLLQ